MPRPTLEEYKSIFNRHLQLANSRLARTNGRPWIEGIAATATALADVVNAVHAGGNALDIRLDTIETKLDLLLDER